MKARLLIWAIIALCTCTAGAQQFEWRQMNSAITAFAQRPDNPQIIFAGDQAGLIRRSIDRGTTWQLVSSASAFRINDIAFLDAEHGLAATDQSGLILLTTDGGATWQPRQFIDATASPNSYRFYPAQRIVVVDDQTAFFDIYYHPISGTLRRETIVTRDGGRTFALDSMPGEVYHAEGSTMIALGRESGQFGLAKFTTYKSTDKGITWNIVKTDPVGLNNDFNNHGIELAFFLSADEFYITANKQLASERNIFKTTDGGNTFTSLSPFDKTFKAKADYIYFKNASEGFAITGSAGGKTTFRTSDGGTTWTPAAQNVELEGLYLGDDTFIAYKNDHTAISTDFGDTWTEQADPISTIRSQGVASLSFLQVLDEDLMYASFGRLSSGVYYGREVVRTTNGGLTWEQMKDGTGQAFKGEAFHFVSKDTFFFFGTGYKEGTSLGGYMKIKYTTDGGITSTDVYTGEYREDIDGVVFITPGDAVTYSINSLIINYSTDGGMNWTQTHFPNAQGQMQRMQFPAMNVWYAQTSTGKLLKSTDRGTSWNEITAPPCGTITFRDAMTGYSHGCRGKLYTTTDGGGTWNDLSSGIAGDIANGQHTIMEFQDAATAYLIDPNDNNSRSLARTTDAGTTLQPYHSSALQSRVIAMDFASENTGAMIDSYGNFARYIGPATGTIDTVRLTTGVASVQPEFRNRDIRLYPNPASDVIVLDAGKTMIRSIEITDGMGNTVATIRDAFSGTAPYTISTNDLAAGTYMITIRTAQGVWSQRLNVLR